MIIVVIHEHKSYFIEGEENKNRRMHRLGFVMIKKNVHKFINEK